MLILLRTGMNRLNRNCNLTQIISKGVELNKIIVWFSIKCTIIAKDKIEVLDDILEINEANF